MEGGTKTSSAGVSRATLPSSIWVSSMLKTEGLGVLCVVEVQFLGYRSIMKFTPRYSKNVFQVEVSTCDKKQVDNS